MSIPASRIVQINPRLLTPGGNDLEFNGLLLSSSADIPSSLVLPFGSPEEVADYFGASSEEARAASVYFLGYANSFKKPRALYVGRRVSAAAKAFLRGGPLPGSAATSLAAIKAITAGTLTLSIGGTSGSLTALNFGSASTLSAVATTLQTAIRAYTQGGTAWTSATVTYSSDFDAFTITSGETAGASSSIGFATAGTAAAPLCLTEATGAVASQGLDSMSIAENMAAIEEVTRNWVTFTTTVKPSSSDALAYAAWASSKGVDYLYLYWDNVTSVADSLTEENVGATACVYDSLEYAAFIMGAAASIDWDRRQGVITFAFKRQEGLAANVIGGVKADSLEAKRVNFMGDYATRNDNFVFMYPGAMLGEWRWIDPYLCAVWLKNALQVSILAGLVQSPRTPYNEVGYTLIRSWCQDPINRALNSGIIDTGVSLSESQKAEVAREAGKDISGPLWTDGYYLQVVDPSPAVRQRRESPEVSLWYTYGGSVHRVTMASTALV